MDRREDLAGKIEAILAVASRGPNVGLLLVEVFERYYSELPAPPKRGELPDRAWVETLWKLAEEKRNTHSSFGAMCQYVLTCMDREATRREYDRQAEEATKRDYLDRYRGPG